MCTCPICSSNDIVSKYLIENIPVLQCLACQVWFLHPQPSNEVLEKKYTSDYFLGSESPEKTTHVESLKRATAQIYLKSILSERQSQHAMESGIQTVKQENSEIAHVPNELTASCDNSSTVNILEIGCGDGYFLAEAEKAGFKITGVEYSEDACKMARNKVSGPVYKGEIADINFSSNTFDVCVIADVIEHVRNPLGFISEIYRILKPGGQIFIATPSTDSWSAKLMGAKWMELKVEHITYFNSVNIRIALDKGGFKNSKVTRGWKILSLAYINMHFTKFRVPFFSLVTNSISALLPKKIKEKPLKIVASGIIATAMKPTEPLSNTRKMAGAIES